MKSKSRYVGILLLALFACGSLASPDLFVLCTGAGESVRVEPFHIVEGACRMSLAHHCDRSEASAAGIHHHHERCTDVGLSGHVGLVKEREKAPELIRLDLLASPVEVRDAHQADGLAAFGGGHLTRSPSNHPPDLGLQSVVLLI